MANVQGNVYGHSDAWGIPFDFYAGATGVVTGSTITMQTALLILNPAGTIAALTAVLPLNPPDGCKAEVTTTQPITSLTVSANSGDSIVNGTLGTVTGLTPAATVGTGSATGTVRYLYTLNGFQAGNTTVNPRTWIRVQ